MNYYIKGNKTLYLECILLSFHKKIYTLERNKNIPPRMVITIVILILAI